MFGAQKVRFALPWLKNALASVETTCTRTNKKSKTVAGQPEEEESQR
jgi:hypothetical protein